MMYYSGPHKCFIKTIPVNNTISLLPFKMNYFGIYQKLTTALLSRYVKDVDIIVNTHGELLPHRTASTPNISYVHFPSFLLTSSADFRNVKYENSLFWKAYFKPYQFMALFLAKRAIRNPGLILANSMFTKNAIKKIFPDINVQVLYPPVDIDRFSKACNSDNVDDSVLLISRFSPEKQIEKAIEVALLLTKVRFEIMGALIPANLAYFKSIQNTIDKHSLSNRIKLKPNATNDEIMDAMSRSSVYLHTMIGEHFGMSIVEAMSAGLVPIVPSYGGCSEIVPIEYQYSTAEEAADCIARTIASITPKTRRRMRDMAMRFSLAEFRKEMKRYIEQVISREVKPPSWWTEAA